MKLHYIKEKESIKIETESSMELRGIKGWFDRYVDGYAFDPAFKNKLWNGKKSLYNKEEDTVPMGLWGEIFRCCQELDYVFDFVNKKDFPINRKVKLLEFTEFVHEFFSDYKFIPREYQIRVAFNVLKNRYCNISVATSGGKTLIYFLTLMYLIKNNPDKKFLLIVPSKTLVTQFYDDILDFNRNKLNINIQEIFDEGEKPRLSDENSEPNLYIGTFQSLVDIDKYPTKWFKQFYSVVGDEFHKGKSKSYRKIFKRTISSAEYRWGMSGTFPDNDTYEMMEIMAKTGPVVDKVTAKELIDEGFITPLKIKGVLVEHNDYEFRDLLERVASRDKKSAYDLEVEKIQESDGRLTVINQIVSKCKDNTLVLFHNTEYGHKLLEYLKTQNPDKEFFYIDGSVKEKGTKKNPEISRQYIKEQMMKTDKVKYILLTFNGYDIEFEENTEILLSNGEIKIAKDINVNDDIDDNFLLKYIK